MTPRFISFCERVFFLLVYTLFSSQSITFFSLVFFFFLQELLILLFQKTLKELAIKTNTLKLIYVLLRRACFELTGNSSLLGKGYGDITYSTCPGKHWTVSSVLQIGFVHKLQSKFPKFSLENPRDMFILVLKSMISVRVLSV